MADITRRQIVQSANSHALKVQELNNFIRSTSATIYAQRIGGMDKLSLAQCRREAGLSVNLAAILGETLGLTRVEEDKMNELFEEVDRG